MMNNSSKSAIVSVIIPFFNRIEETCNAIISVFMQTFVNYEIILINDCSNESDASILKLINKRKNIKYLKLSKNVGPAEARNKGICQSKGVYLAFLDSDDVWLPTKLELQIDIMNKNKWNFSHTSYIRYDSLSGELIKINSGKTTYFYPWAAFRCRIATPTVVVKRSCLPLELFNKNLREGEDVLMWFEISKNYPLYGIDLPLSKIFVNEKSTQRNKLLKDVAIKNIGELAFSNNCILRITHLVYQIVRRLIFNFKYKYKL